MIAAMGFTLALYLAAVWAALKMTTRRIRCGATCMVHDGLCVLNPHSDYVAHRCLKCPWPASRRMVRR